MLQEWERGSREVREVTEAVPNALHGEAEKA